MITTPLVIAGLHHCIKCGTVISNAALAEGNYIGSESNGFTCCDCIIAQLQSLQLFGQELTTFYSDTDYPCARCGKPFEEGYLVEIDGKLGELCNACSQWYFTHGGIPKGTEAEWILKLK